MRPELAKNVAELLLWAPNNSPLVSMGALSLMYASWISPEGISLLHAAELLESEYVSSLETREFASKDLYLGQSDKPHVGALTGIHAYQAVQRWAAMVPAQEMHTLRGLVATTLRAALQDTSGRTRSLASRVQKCIVELSWTEEGPKGRAAQVEALMQAMGVPDINPKNPIMLMTPEGPKGPFASRAAVADFLLKNHADFDEAEEDSAAATPAAQSSATGGEGKAVEDGVAEVRIGMAIYDQSAAIGLMQRMPPQMPGDGNAEYRHLLHSMANDDGWREFTMMPEGNPLAEMYAMFPHFSHVLDFIAGSLALAGCGDEGAPVRIPPLLLRGVPGTGKSFFAAELARVLGTVYEERDLSTLSDAFALCGLASTYKNSKPGIVLECLVNGRTANPLICLNEIDKPNKANNSPIAPLRALLEPSTAANYKDEFCPIPLETSRVIWVMTANDGEIPSEIVQRVEDFNVAPPSKEQCRAIATSVWKLVCGREFPKGHNFALELGEPLLQAVSSMSPRVMRKVLTHAARLAITDGRRYLKLEDLGTSQKRYADTSRKSIGF